MKTSGFISHALSPTAVVASFPSHYSPRFRRNRRTRTTLAPIELEILTTIHGYRLLTTAHLLQLLCPGSTSKDTLYRTLRRLYDSGHVHRLPDTNLIKWAPEGGFFLETDFR